jgi:hypothetical protein
LLAKRGDAAGVPMLMQAAADPSAVESERTTSIKMLGEIKATQARALIIELLDDVRLRPTAASALGRIGGRPARRALSSALERERYPVAREAEARALIELKDPGVRRLIERFLGTDTSIPSGVLMLEQLGALSARGTVGGRLMDGTTTLRVPASATRKPARVTVAVNVSLPESTVVIADQVIEVAPGAQQVSVPLPASAVGTELALSASEGVALVAFVVVAQTLDVAPPRPVPVPAAPDAPAP